MKTVCTLVIAVVLGSTAALAQSKTVENFHNKYKDDRDAKVVTLTGGLFKIFATIASFDEEDEDAQALARIAQNIESMEILSIPMYKSGFSADDVEKMRSDLGKEQYEELITVRDGQEKVYFLTQGDKNTVKNMLVLIKEKDEFAVMNVKGTLDLKDVAYLAKHRNNWN